MPIPNICEIRSRQVSDQITDPKKQSKIDNHAFDYKLKLEGTLKFRADRIENHKSVFDINNIGKFGDFTQIFSYPKLSNQIDTPTYSPSLGGLASSENIERYVRCINSGAFSCSMNSITWFDIKEMFYPPSGETSIITQSQKSAEHYLKHDKNATWIGKALVYAVSFFLYPFEVEKNETIQENTTHPENPGLTSPQNASKESNSISLGF